MYERMLNKSEILTEDKILSTIGYNASKLLRTLNRCCWKYMT